MTEPTRLGIPALDNDPSLRAVATVIEQRWDALPVRNVLVWRLTEDSNPDAMKHVARMLGLGDLDLDFGVLADPVPVLRRGSYLKRRRGSKGVILESLAGAGIAAEDVQFIIGASWLHDGSITYSGSDEFTHGSDGHWAIVVVRVTVQEAPTLAQVQAIWLALDNSKSERDHVTLVIRMDGESLGTYREFPEEL